jgi:dolichol-phosphate mannosyltransferase
MSGNSQAVSIVVPTYREAANIPALVRRVFAAVAETGLEAELIFVDDDSRDGTIEAVDALSDEYPVRLITRVGERGLSSAVLAGFAEARFDRFVVLDADLQHPPEIIPDLLAPLDDDACDFVLGTRYAGAGEIVEEWPWHRRLTSLVAKWMARPLTPLSDPLSGCFALPRRVWERADELNPIGYKIALELYVKGRCRNPAEVAIRFGTRQAGESKLTGGEILRYVQHLAMLYSHRYPWLTGTLLAGAIALAFWLALRFLTPC